MSGEAAACAAMGGDGGVTIPVSISTPAATYHRESGTDMAHESGLPLSVMPGDEPHTAPANAQEEDVVTVEGAPKSAEERACEAEERAQHAEERVRQLMARMEELMKITQEARLATKASEEAQKRAAEETEERVQSADRRADFAGKRCEQLATRLHDASEELAQEQQRAKEEVKQWEDKYEALDAKLGRLHAKAKEKIQGLQKEKEEAEKLVVKEGEKYAQLMSRHVAVSEERDEVKLQLKGESARAQQGALTEARLLEEIARARAQAAEVLRAAGINSAALQKDLEAAKEREEGLHKLVEAKGKELRELRDAASAEARQQLQEEHRKVLSLCEQKHAEMVKEREAEHAQLVKEREQQHTKDVSELQMRLQQKVAAYESQLDEATGERDNATALVKTLQLQVAEKETGLAVQAEEISKLREFLSLSKKETAQLQEEWDGEREVWKGTIRAYEVEARNATLRAKEEIERREAMEREHHLQAVAAAEARGILEAEFEGHRQALSHTQSELVAARDKHARAEAELAGYKVRAHALMKKRDAELAAMKDVKLAAEQEEAREMELREAKRECDKFMASRDAARRELQQALKDNEMQSATHAAAIAERDREAKEAQARYQAMRTQLDASQADCHAQVEAAIATWKAKCDALEQTAKKREEEQRRNLLGRGGNSFSAVLQNSSQLKAEIERLRETSLRERAGMEKRIGELEEEITHLKEAAKKRPETPRQSSLARLAFATSQYDAALGTEMENGNTASNLADVLEDAESEDQILVLARLQAMREDEVEQCKRQISSLQQELADMERECKLRMQQEAMLKEEFRNMERTKNREGVDMMYLKNVILKLLETREVDALMPVIAMLLQFSPDEVKRAKAAYKSQQGNDARRVGSAKADATKLAFASPKN